MNYRDMIYKGMLLTALCVLLTACNDWLDVQPESQVEDTELFKSETGFKEALSGVYSSMVSDNTYAKELTFGAIGVMGQEWDRYPSSSYGPSYQDIINYDYTTSAAQSMIASVWTSLYNGIANVNNILKHIDGAEKKFTGKNFAIIKGEALALRAFQHFDLLRCFGVSYAVDPDMPAIPYCTDLTYRVFPQLTVKQVAEKIETDLLEAEKLLAVDPILTGEEITELNDNGYLMNRQVHLNYYAVKGLQARLYMWMQRYTDAEACAKAVIDSEVFTWATNVDMSEGTDMAFATEQLFALNNMTLSTLSETYFDPEGSLSVFGVEKQKIESEYYVDYGDYRLVYGFAPGLGDNSDYWFLKKYNVLASTDLYYVNKMPLIRLSEMFLIQAECEYRAGNAEAYKTWNVLRTNRGASELNSNPSDFYGELINEYRREFFGEGVLFFLYKRLNSATIYGSTETDIIASKGYTFPLPMSETDAAQRENNR